MPMARSTLRTLSVLCVLVCSLYPSTVWGAKALASPILVLPWSNDISYIERGHGELFSIDE